MGQISRVQLKKINMIDPHALIGIALFAWNNKDKPTTQDVWKPTNSDTHTLREGMKEFTVKKIDNCNWYPFEQYCLSKGIVSVGEGMYEGQLQISNTFEWYRLNKTHSLMQWQDEKDMEKMFTAFPEERVSYEIKLETVKNEIRALFGKMKVV